MASEAFNNMLARRMADPEWARHFAAESARIAAIDAAENEARNSLLRGLADVAEGRVSRRDDYLDGDDEGEAGVQLRRR